MNSYQNKKTDVKILTNNESVMQKERAPGQISCNGLRMLYVMAPVLFYAAASHLHQGGRPPTVLSPGVA